MLSFWGQSWIWGALGRVPVKKKKNADALFFLPIFSEALSRAAEHRGYESLVIYATKTFWF